MRISGGSQTQNISIHCQSLIDNPISVFVFISEDVIRYLDRIAILIDSPSHFTSIPQ